MLQLAAAALVIDRARRRYAGAACLHQLQQLGIAILLLGLQDLRPDLLTGQRSRHKQGKAVHAAYPFAFMGHADDIEHHLVVLIHWQIGGRRRTFPAAPFVSAAVFIHRYRSLLSLSSSITKAPADPAGHRTNQVELIILLPLICTQ
ncbi:hypothetical protein D3C73_1223350 [compost metagenome]